MRNMSCLSDRRIAAIIFTCSFLFFVITMGREFAPYDEALVLVGATRVAEGAIPHRDFYANYGPANFYVLAGLFKLFGTSVLVERAWDTFIRAATVTVAFFLVQRAASRREAWVASVLILLWLRAFGFYAYPVFPLALVRAARSPMSFADFCGPQVAIAIVLRRDLSRIYCAFPL